MKKISTLLPVVLALAGCAGPSGGESGDSPDTTNQTASELPMQGFYIGTYTNETSEGIYYSELDPSTGQLAVPQLTATSNNPSYLALAENGKYLYAVNENPDKGEISAFRVGEDNLLEEIDSRSSEGMYPCFISLVNDRQALVANYGGGNVLSAALTSEGLFGESTAYAHQGTGANPDRQEAPHAHSIRPVPGTDFALAADLGADKVYQYRMGSGGLTLIDSIGITPGGGPRHIEFHPALPVIYIINELNSTVEVYSWEKENNTFNHKQIISTLPDGYDSTNYCADIHITPDGKLLFGSNRGHGSIVSYRVREDGLLDISGHYTDGVDWPRNFAISPDGGYVVIANQHGKSVITAAIDKQTGQLSSTGYRIEVSQPSCILFK